MAFDLFSQEGSARIDSLPRVNRPEPGAFDNFLAGTAKFTMQGFAKAGRSVDLLGSVGPIIEDRISGGTEAQDRYFREHDEVFGRAVDYWTPKPGEVGAAGEVVGQLLSTIPQIASPGFLVGNIQMSVGEDLVNKGVPADKARAAGLVMGAGTALGVWVPILGNNLWQRAVLGGAGFNVAQGVAMRGVAGQVLEGTAAEEDFKAFDWAGLTLDVLLGFAFGGMAHVNPAMRAEGQRWSARIADWAGTLKAEDVDALATLRQAQHLNVDSAPGRPADLPDLDAHVTAMRQAIDDLVNDRPVNVEETVAGAKFEPDPARAAENEVRAQHLVDEAERIRREEAGLGELWDFARENPLADPDALIVRLEPAHLDAILIDKGPALLRDGEVRVTGKELKNLFGSERGYGAVKVIYRHGPESVKAGTPFEVMRQDLLDLPTVMREFDPLPNAKGEIPGRGAPKLEWVVDRPDGRRVMYAVSQFTRDGKQHLSSIHVLERPEGRAASGRRNEAAPTPGQPLGRRQDPDTTAGSVTTEADRPSELSPPQGRGAEKSIAQDPVAIEASRFATENPDVPIRIGEDAEGNAITKSARQYLEEADLMVARASEDAKLFEVAAACMLGAA